MRLCKALARSRGGAFLCLKKFSAAQKKGIRHKIKIIKAVA